LALSSADSLALREPYSTADQQRDTATLGMWIFLVTEVMFFGGLFAGFAIYRMYYTQGFIEGSSEMDLLLGAINTAVLISSSLTMALSVYNSSIGKQFQTYLCLLATAALGIMFLAIKFTEYYIHYQHRKVPGIWFESGGPHHGGVEMFFVYYFCMTGLHAIHMIIGISLVLALAVRTALGRFRAAYHTPVTIVGLYWHFVDIVWVFLFAIFYISGMHQ
jgi:cytochrome c oxidase subunit 3